MTKRTALTMAGTACALAIGVAIVFGCARINQEPASYIVRADSTELAGELVSAVGGAVTHELGIIEAVAATLTPQQLTDLRSREAVRQVTVDGSVETAAGAMGPYVNFPELVGADLLHAEGYTGRSVTVAILDSGMAAIEQLNKDTSDKVRRLRRYNSITDQEGTHLDKYGHGTTLPASSSIQIFRMTAPAVSTASRPMSKWCR